MIGATSTELFRKDGENFHSVQLYQNPDSSIRLGAQDMGPSVEQFFGSDDYEYWVDVSPGALCKLVAALLREKYTGHSSAVEEFREFCKTEAIEHKWESWP